MMVPCSLPRWSRQHVPGLQTADRQGNSNADRSWAASAWQAAHQDCTKHMQHVKLCTDHGYMTNMGRYRDQDSALCSVRRKISPETL